MKRIVHAVLGVLHGDAQKTPTGDWDVLFYRRGKELPWRVVGPYYEELCRLYREV